MNEDNFDIGLTIQSQYSASPHIVALVNGFWSCLDPSADIELIFNKMINPIHIGATNYLKLLMGECRILVMLPTTKRLTALSN